MSWCVSPRVILFGTLCASWTWVTISFPMLGKFSPIISSHIFSDPLSSLIAVANTSKTMLNNSGESGQPCLVPDLSGNGFSF